MFIPETSASQFRLKMQQILKCSESVDGEEPQKYFQYLFTNRIYLSGEVKLAERSLVTLDFASQFRHHREFLRIRHFCRIFTSQHKFPLHEAARNGDVSKIKKLLAKGVNPNERDALWRTALYHSVATNKLEAAKILVRSTKRLNELALSVYEQTNVLHLAAIKGNKEMVKLLISRGASSLVKTNQNRDIIDLAIEHGYLELADWLFRKGFGVGEYALLLACKKGSLDSVKIVMRHILPRIYHLHENVSGRKLCCVPLLMACRGGSLDIVNYMLCLGFSLHGRDEEGNTALHLAVMSCNEKMVSLVLANLTDMAKIAVNAQGDTALMFSIRISRSDIAAILLEDSSVQQKSKNFKEAVEMAKKQSMPDLVEKMERLES